MKFFNKAILSSLVFTLVTGCETWQPGDEKIKLVSGTVPAACQFRGNVDSGLAKAPLVSHKNQALKWQANVVLVTHQETKYYLPYVPPLYPLVIALKSHQMRGAAYYCDRKAMDWLDKHPSTVSDVRQNEL